MPRVYDPGHNEPRTDLEKAADLALKAAETDLARVGLTLKHALVILHVEELPEGGDSVTAGHGYEDSADVLTHLLGHLGGMAKAMGLRLDVIPDMRPPGQG